LGFGFPGTPGLFGLFIVHHSSFIINHHHHNLRSYISVLLFWLPPKRKEAVENFQILGHWKYNL
jgi:hypothetical protein